MILKVTSKGIEVTIRFEDESINFIVASEKELQKLMKHLS